MNAEYGKTGVKIVRNDITRERVDAIVTPAHWVAEIGTGVDKAIHAAAGPRLFEARKEIGILEQGDAFATPAFNLSAKYVIHTLGPFWEDGERHEKLILRLCYVNVLKEALLRKCKSVAIPLLSAGNFGMPPDEALDCAIRAIRGFLARGHEIEVRLIVVDEKAWAHARKTYPDITSSVLVDADVRTLVGEKTVQTLQHLRPDEKTEYFEDVKWHLHGKTFAEVYGRLLADFTESQKEQRRVAAKKGVQKGDLERFRTTQAAVAADAGISTNYLKRLIGKKSKIKPGKDKVLALAQAIGCNRQETVRLLQTVNEGLDRFDRRDALILSVIGTRDWQMGRLSDLLEVADLGPLRLK